MLIAVADSSTSPTHPGYSPAYIPSGPTAGGHEAVTLPDRPSPSAGLLKPSVVIRRGPRGYGFTLRAIRVYYGESEYYTLHHLVVVRSFVFAVSLDILFKSSIIITKFVWRKIQVRLSRRHRCCKMRNVTS